MSSVTTAHAPFRPIKLPRGAIVAIVALCAATGSVIFRMYTALPFPTFVGACQRLRASGLAVTTRDWFCRATPLSARAAYSLALLLIAVGLVVPCAILASTGRRWSSLAPLAVAPFVKPPVFFASWWDAGSHGNGWLLMAMNGAVLAAPVVAIWLVARRRRSHERLDLAAGLIAGVACSLASFGIAWWANRIVAEHWASLGGGTDIHYLIPSAIAMALFAAMLGTDRRWWPWSLIPVAVLLSFGPSAALVWSPEHLTDWSFFGGVAPLVALGLVWSVWRLLVVRLSSRVHRDPTGAADGSPEGSTVTAPRTGRLRFELNAAAAALLLISIVMFKADPLPVQEGTSLPTYLGERIQAQDVRTKLDLRQAMAASDAYAVRNGSYRGFDAAAGLRMDPTLAWSDGHVASTRSGTVPALTMSIERASGDTARIAARSDGGAVFCMQRTGDGSLRYGRAAGEGDPSLFERAIARCGSTPWSASAVRMPDTARMCDGVDRSGGYLICRMVQVLITDTMRRTKPA